MPAAVSWIGGVSSTESRSVESAMCEVLSLLVRTSWTPSERVPLATPSSTEEADIGALFLVGYIVSIGVATFLMKYVSKDLSAYQINALMAVGMVVTGLPALWIAERTFALPRKALPLGATVGLLMAIGSILYVLAVSKLPVGLASAIATSYVVLVVVLSRVVLDEALTPVKGVGIALTLVGVAMLSYGGT